MSYEYVLSSRGSKRTAKGYGPCNGQLSSLRSEASGMLAVSLFPSLIQAFTNNFFECISVKFLADNNSLIKRQRHHQEYTIPYTNNTVVSEYDLTEQIYQTHQTSSIETIFSHVKGHQDDNDDYKKLPLHAQLNVDTNRLADLYHKKGHASKQECFLLPACPASIAIQGVIITNDYN